MKILVANRGEIACRILATLRDMGVPSVAVHSDIDAEARHVFLADEAVALGETHAYLDIPRIIEAAQSSGATAIHPGYGFLSENAAFARACRDAGIVFIGPSPESMAALGDKRVARRLAEENGVGVIPGERSCDSVDDARTAAGRIGYPVLLKAAGGGGGKGMRLVSAEADLEDAFSAAQREAGSAFADERLIIEKYIAPARHIEVQILGNGTDAVALGERECSLQRRYQKVIEEAPSSGINAKTRKALLEAAVKLARAARYAGAGTVEFLVDTAGAHYFLEVNTRLQVEHPVTELIAGLDLVRAQVEIAHGGKLPVPQSPRGHAIEARLNAEDPYNGFLPATGRILMLDWPGRPGLRIDSGLREGSEVTPFYDPLVAKLIAWGADRDEARRRLIEALRSMTLLGVVTNRPFLLQILEREFFIEGKTYTSTLEAESWDEPEPPEEVVAAARRALSTPLGASDGGSGLSDRYSPWDPGAGGGRP
jgi:acetyl/propionyl-CoA carboxylase alpha subunit